MRPRNEKFNFTSKLDIYSVYERLNNYKKIASEKKMQNMRIVIKSKFDKDFPIEFFKYSKDNSEIIISQFFEPDIIGCSTHVEALDEISDRLKQELGLYKNSVSSTKTPELELLTKKVLLRYSNAVLFRAGLENLSKSLEMNCKLDPASSRKVLLRFGGFTPGVVSRRKIRIKIKEESIVPLTKKLLEA
jgi:hypothetical protein